MQKTGAGLHTANSCYWDTAMDGKQLSVTSFELLLSKKQPIRMRIDWFSSLLFSFVGSCSLCFSSVLFSVVPLLLSFLFQLGTTSSISPHLYPASRKLPTYPSACLSLQEAAPWDGRIAPCTVSSVCSLWLSHKTHTHTYRHRKSAVCSCERQGATMCHMSPHPHIRCM